MLAGAKRKLGFQHIVYLLLITAFVYAIYKYRDQLADIVVILQGGVWYIVLATVLVLMLAIYNQATLYASIYRILALPSEKRDLLPLYLVRRFVTVAAPSGGFSGWVPFLHFARRHELGVGSVFIANWVYTILWYSTFGLFLLLGLLYLFIMHDLQWFEISAALIVLAANLVMIAGLVLAWVAPHLLQTILHALAHLMERLAARLRRRPPLTDAQITAFSTDLVQAIAHMQRAGWQRLLIPAAHALLNEALNLLMFFLLAQAFHLHLSFGVLVAAYSISILFFIVSPTPGGLGFVEGTLVVVLTSLGVPLNSATVVTLAYRGITFWLPFVLGFAALRWINRSPAPH